MAEEPRRPRGKALRWTPTERAARAQPTTATRIAAALWWRQHAPPRWRRLLEAREVDTRA